MAAAPGRPVQKAPQGVSFRPAPQRQLSAGLDTSRSSPMRRPRCQLAALVSRNAGQTRHFRGSRAQEGSSKAVDERVGAEIGGDRFCHDAHGTGTIVFSRSSRQITTDRTIASPRTRSRRGRRGDDRIRPRGSPNAGDRNGDERVVAIDPRSSLGGRSDSPKRRRQQQPMPLARRGRAPQLGVAGARTSAWPGRSSSPKIGARHAGRPSHGR